MTAIVNATQIDSVLPGQWTTFLSSVTVNGRAITGSSNASTSEFYQDELNVTVPDGQTVATFDTGTSYGASLCVLVRSQAGSLTGGAQSRGR